MERKEIPSLLSDVLTNLEKQGYILQDDHLGWKSYSKDVRGTNTLKIISKITPKVLSPYFTIQEAPQVSLEGATSRCTVICYDRDDQYLGYITISVTNGITEDREMRMQAELSDLTGRKMSRVGVYIIWMPYPDSYSL